MRKDIYEVIKFMKIKGIKPNYAEISRQYQCDYRTVKRYYNARDDSYKKPRKQRIIKKKIDGFEDKIKEKVDYKAPAIAIYNLLKSKHGYTGSYSTIKSYVHNLKKDLNDEVTIHFETEKGKQCQIDWKEELELTSKYGEVFKVNIFLSILGYSRFKYIELTFDRSQNTLFKCLTNSFVFYGGVPKELLFDNMKTVVDKSRTQFNKPVYNEKLYEFSKDAGFIAKSCMAYRPKTKGKVETLARIVNRLKVYNNEFKTISELIEIVKKLNKEINEEIQVTTKEKPIERFKKEKEYLNPLPRIEVLETYFKEKVLVRKVPKNCLITYEGLKYSVSPAVAGKSVTLVRQDDNLYIYYNQNLISSHSITGKPINYNESDYKEILKYSFIKEKDIERICQDNLDIFDKLNT